MNDYDPFSGGSNFNRYGSAPKKKTNKLQPLITKGLVIFIILAIVGAGVYYLFFNNVAITFEVKDTEGKTVNAKIKITNVKNVKSKIIEPGDELKVGKNSMYNYSVSANGYTVQITEPLPTDIDDKITVVLEKNISVSIDNFKCPEKVFLGQKVLCQIDLKNTSTSEDFSVENIVFTGLDSLDDFKNKTYKFVNSEGDELSTARKTILPTTNVSVYLSFYIPNDKKLAGKKTLKARIKYKKKDISTQFEIIESPNITFSSNLSTANMSSGEEQRFTYTIDNSKNQTNISNLTLSIDANYVSNYDFDFKLEEVILKDRINVEIDSKSKTTGQITVKLPQTIRAGKIEGKIILSGSVFSEDRFVPFVINIKEPENKLSISLTKTNESLTYDEENEKTTEKIIQLKIDNQNAFKVKINSIETSNLSNHECEKWMFVTSEYNGYDIQSKRKIEIPIVIKGEDLENMLNIKGTKLCAITTKYEHPFTGEEIEEKINFTITVG